MLDLVHGVDSAKKNDVLHQPRRGPQKEVGSLGLEAGSGFSSPIFDLIFT